MIKHSKLNVPHIIALQCITRVNMYLVIFYHLALHETFKKKERVNNSLINVCLASMAGFKLSEKTSSAPGIADTQCESVDSQLCSQTKMSDNVHMILT